MRALIAPLLLLAVTPFFSAPASAREVPPLEQLLSQARTPAPPAPAPPAPEIALPLPPETSVPGTDVTAGYDSALAAASSSSDAVYAGLLKDYKVIFVPGFLSDFDPATIHIPGVTFQHKIYFDEQLAWLKRLGVETSRLSMKSEDSVAQNAPAVEAAIRSSDKPVILIAHSKGGLDTLEALLSDRALLSKVRGLITLQSPFSGTPVADYVVAHTTLDDIAVDLLLKLGGNKESMINMTTDNRVPYMEANSAGVAAVEAAVPVLSVATWKDPVPGKFDTKLKPVRDFLLRRGLRNDGLVPVSSALLPGSYYIKIPGLDHTVTVRPSNYIPLDRVAMTKALLREFFSLPVRPAGHAGIL